MQGAAVEAVPDIAFVLVFEVALESTLKLAIQFSRFRGSYMAEPSVRC